MSLREKTDRPFLFNQRKEPNMKKTFFSLLLSVFFIATMVSCADNKTIDGREYETYGVFNRDEIKNPCIHYTLSVGNAVWGVLLFETVIFPIYFYGFSLYEPQYKIYSCKEIG